MKTIKNVVVLGGGTAGWLTALFLKKTFDNIEITVVEDPAKPPIIAGESGSANLYKIYQYLGIDMEEWVSATHAMPKAGGKFVDWKLKGTEFDHTLINSYSYYEYLYMMPEFSPHYEFLSMAIARGVPIADVFLSGRLVKENKVPMIMTNSGFEFIDLIMWHFDSRANADYLKNKSLQHGIKLLERTYSHATLTDQGCIDSIHFTSNDSLTADWFFDCSGFARLLLGKALNEPFKDYSQYFPASSVVAWWDKSVYKPYTEVTAMDAGWAWNINLENRSGNGYVYDSTILTVDQAVLEAENRFNTKIDPVANISFTPSTVENFWQKNVIGLGLSTGFIEPLESNGLALVAIQLQYLITTWSPAADTVSDAGRKAFNKLTREATENIIHFLNLHYRGKRTDTEFWRKVQSTEYSTDFVKELISQWQDGVIVSSDFYGSYSVESFMFIAQALELVDTKKLADKLQSKRSTILDEFDMCYGNLQRRITEAAETCLAIEDAKKYFYKKPL